MNKNIKCAIFDLDGTLLNTIDSIAYFANETLKKVFSLPPIDVETYKYYIGNGAEKLIRRSLKHHGIEDEESFKKAFEYYNKIYDADPYYLIEVYEGIAELVSELKRRGLRLGVISNKPHYPTCEIIKKYFGENTFEVVYGARDGFPKKPDPAVPLSIAEIFDAKPSECIYIGDTNTDMQTGKNAGFYTVGVLWGFRKKEELVEANADEIAEIPSDILKFL